MRIYSFDRRVVLVAGMHRSGTSAITRVLNLAGADLAPDLIPPDPANFRIPYWESREVVEINDGCLLSAGLTSSDIVPLPSGWLESAAVQKLRDQALDLLRRHFSSSSLLVIKDPRICRLIPFWVRVLADFQAEPRFVIPLRNPLEVADSLKRRNGMQPQWAHLLWLRHLLDAERDSRPFSRLVVSFPDLLKNWSRCLQRIRRQLALEDLKPAPEQHAEIARFLEPELKSHHYSDSDLSDSPVVPGMLKSAYAIFGEAARGGDLARHADRLDQLRQQLDQSCRTLDPFLRACVPLCASAGLRTAPDSHADPASRPIPGPRVLAPGPSLSAVVLTWNGEQKLRRVLPSLQPVCDELIVFVDGDSRDRSREVAAGFTPLVEHVPHLGTQEAHLERMVTRCSGDWILLIDDDELLEAWDAAGLPTLLADRRLTHYYLPRKWVLPGERNFIASAPWYPDYQMRLFRNLPSILRYPSTIHEEIRVAGRAGFLSSLSLRHFNLAWKSRQQREEMVRYYHSLHPHPGEMLYLFEECDFQTAPLDRPTYRIGDLLEFAPNALGIQYLAEGWSPPEDWGCWMDGHQSHLRLPLQEPPGHNLRLSARATALVHPRSPEVGIHVAVNGERVATWVFKKGAPQVRQAAIDSSVIHQSELRITFSCDRPRSPRELNGSPDDRLLSMGLVSLQLDPA